LKRNIEPDDADLASSTHFRIALLLETFMVQRNFPRASAFAQTTVGRSEGLGGQKGRDNERLIVDGDKLRIYLAD
jgi:hypothetical protein